MAAHAHSVISDAIFESIPNLGKYVFSIADLCPFEPHMSHPLYHHRTRKDAHSTIIGTALQRALAARSHCAVQSDHLSRPVHIPPANLPCCVRICCECIRHFAVASMLKARCNCAITIQRSVKEHYTELNPGSIRPMLRGDVYQIPNPTGNESVSLDTQYE